MSNKLEKEFFEKFVFIQVFRLMMGCFRCGGSGGSGVGVVSVAAVDEACAVVSWKASCKQNGDEIAIVNSA